ncbi:hypothetical protein QQZ08_004659, partial [Neonectria magnoliae]
TLVERVAKEAVEAAKRCHEELKAVTEAQGLSSEVSKQGGSIWDSDLPEQVELLDSDLALPDFDFTHAVVDIMGMDWMGDWVMDDMVEFPSLSWESQMNTVPPVPYI